MLPIRLSAMLCGGVFVILLGISTSELFAGEMRIWKAAEGPFQVEAALTAQSETHVKLKKKDGTELTVPREKLSKEDLDYLLFADPPLPKFAGTDKSAGAPKPVATEKPAAKDKPSGTDNPANTDKSAGTKKPPTPAKPAVEPKPSDAPPVAEPDSTTVSKERTKQTTPDTFESIRRSFDESFDAVANPDKQEPLPAGPGTNYVALVNELRTPIKLPTFAAQAVGNVPLTVAAKESWQETTCLAAGGTFLLEYDAAGKQLLVWNIETGKQAGEWKCGAPANSRCFAISPAGKYLAIGKPDRSVDVYEVAAKKVVRTVKINEKHLSVFRVAFNWQEKDVYVLTETPDLMVFALDGGQDRGTSLVRYLPEAVHTEKEPFKFDIKEEQIEFAIAANGRMGVHLNDQFHLSFDAAKHPRPLVYETAEPFHAVVSVRHGNFAWVSQIAIHSQVQIIPKHPEIKSEITAERAGATFGKAERFSVDRDERFVWACHADEKSRVVEIIDVNYVQRSLKVILPAPAGGVTPEDRLWVSAEKKSVVCWSPSSKQLTVFKMQNFAEPACWRLYSLVLQAFLEKRYEFLDGFFAELGKLALPLPGSDSQLPLEEAVEYFSDRPMHVHPVNWRFRTDSWYKDRPDSMGPRFVYADQIMDEGWAARGGGFAGSVTAEGWEKFRKAGLLSAKLLEPIMEQKQPPAYAFVMQHNITKMNRRPAEEQVEIAKRLSKFYPECAEYHAGMVFNLLPRWYGKQGDSVAYADKIAELLQGDAGDIAYAEMGYSLVNTHPLEVYVRATEFDPDRVTRGLLKAVQRNPEDARPYYRLMHWVFSMRFFNPDSDVLDPELDAESEKEYKQALTQFERLVARHDWTLYDTPELVAVEYAIFKKNAGPPPKPKRQPMPNAN